MLIATADITEDRPLTKEDVETMEPGHIFASGFGFVEHPWFNNAIANLEEDGRSVRVKWVAYRGYAADWKIYHSLDANLEPSDFLDGTVHLEASWERILNAGAGLHDRDAIRRLVPCTDEALAMYRD